MNIHPHIKNSHSCSFEELKAGQINSGMALKLFEDYRKNLSVKENLEGMDKDKRKEEEVKFLPVFVYPLKYRRITEYGKLNRASVADVIYPICLPAILSREGILLGDLNLSPFISRRYLSPQSSETSFPEIASVSDQDDFFTQNAYAPSSSEIQEENGFSLIDWNTCWNYAETLLKYLLDTDLRNLEIPRYMLDEGGVLVCSYLPQTPSRYLMQLYDILREKRPSTLLLDSFLSSSQKKEKKVPKSKVSTLVNEKLVAQMNQDRSLSYSQNVVMNYFLDDKNDLFLTVNGPPGSGKTTFIQSLIANIWVKAALDQTEPPIIVATSTNNNAVTNVLESFKTKNNVSDPFFKRWLPHIHSFGTYCVSSAKMKKETELKQGWLVTEANHKNIISYLDDKVFVDVENLEYFGKARIEFKRNFSETFEKKLENLSDMSEFLHEQLNQAVNDLKSGCHYQKQLSVPFDKSFAKEKLTSLKEDIQFWRQKHKNFKLFEKELPFYVRWNRYIAVMRKILGQVEERHFKEFCLYEHFDNEFQSFYSENVENFIVCQVKKSQEDSKSVSYSLEMREKQEHQWQKWCLKHDINCKVEDLIQTLNDHPLRTRIFYLATHYWEAKWLQDMERWLKQKDKTRTDPKEVWLRRAKLSPCFVSTLYMLPRFFEHASFYLYNFIDYLIFDESGQVNTYVAAPSLALAKRAIIVGDTKQLEPIHNIPEVVDKGNCKKFNLIDAEEDYKEFTTTGLAATYNSLMNRAHYLCDFKQAEDLEETGFFLREHWRCVPEIASYCNELAYHGYLEPKRSPLENRLYPALGYAHIPGIPEMRGGSRYNPLEAHVIGKWLKKNEGRIRQYYDNKPLHEIVAIITPFKVQAQLLKNVVDELKVANDMTIGTVHSLQGAERPLIIFSPTYGEDDSLYFVDRKVNFFNVALSRAKDSFLVFGNMAQFNTASATPSGLLVRKLFAHEDNEIVDIDVPTHQRLKALKVEFIDNLDRHRILLKDCIQKATKRILIVSPYISINAINDDNLETLISEAVHRGTEVAIITDHYLDKQREDNTLRGREKLEKAGAVVNLHHRIHDKVICVDDHTHVSGSFNWLSTSRTREYAKEERSTLCKGGTQVSEEINKHWKRVNTH